jgi:uncharacterized caspase-like protein
MKYALIIGNNKYDDQKLAQLKTPAADSQALAKILDDKTIGSFDEVTPLINQTETRVRRAISTFLTNKKPDDLVLLYFSGHGVLDDRGRLYLALKDTQVNLLKATSISSSFVADEMDSCRSKRQILILDCCHSGAFARGTKGEQKAITETTFEGSGFGRVVLTASDSTQYALEGDQVIKQTELSLFTHFLLDGLKTGEADMNNDGLIALDEWYDYTYAKVVSETPRQVPHKWSYNQQGDLVIAKNPFIKKKVMELPDELVQALESSFFGIRESAVNELGKYLQARDPEMVELAISSLKKMKEDDSRRISTLAERLLSDFEKTRTPAIKATPPQQPVKMEPETAKSLSDELIVSPKRTTAVEAPSVAEIQTSQPNIDQANASIDTSIISQKSVFNRSFWFKWIGITILGIIVSSIVVDFDISLRQGDYVSLSYFLVIVFGAVAGGLSFIQWFLLRDRLADWWIAVNAAVGVIFGLLHRYLTIKGWEQESLRIFLAVWLIGNFILGLILIRKADEKPGIFSPKLPTKPATKLVETGAHQKAEGLVFDRAFWFKWIGTTTLATVFSVIFYKYNLSVDGAETPVLVILFAAMAGLSSLLQWFMFQNHLAVWWVGGNIVAGIILGWLQNFLYNHNEWWGDEYFRILLILWIIGNFVLGVILVQNAKEKSSIFPSAHATQPAAKLMGTGTQPNIFSISLSLSLILFFLWVFSTQLSLTSARDIFTILFGIANILVSIAFLQKKEIPRNFGFIALAISSFLYGIFIEFDYFTSNFPLSSFSIPALISLSSGLFFITQEETRKDFRFIMLSGFLISVSVVQITRDISVIYNSFSIISALFALVAAIFFFRGR